MAESLKTQVSKLKEAKPLGQLFCLDGYDPEIADFLKKIVMKGLIYMKQDKWEEALPEFINAFNLLESKLELFEDEIENDEIEISEDIKIPLKDKDIIIYGFWHINSAVHACCFGLKLYKHIIHYTERALPKMECNSIYLASLQHYNLGVAYYYLYNDTRIALKCLKTAQEMINEESINGRSSRPSTQSGIDYYFGLCHLKDGEFQIAINFLKAACEKLNDSENLYAIDALALLGPSFFQLGKKRIAFEYLEQFKRACENMNIDLKDYMKEKGERIPMKFQTNPSSKPNWYASHIYSILLALKGKILKGKNRKRNIEARKQTVENNIKIFQMENSKMNYKLLEQILRSMIIQDDVPKFLNEFGYIELSNNNKNQKKKWRLFKNTCLITYHVRKTFLNEEPFCYRVLSIFEKLIPNFSNFQM